MTAELDPLAPLVERARAGEARALDELVRRVQDGIYGVALRMLGDVGAAEDATQEALIRVVTHLSAWRGESRFLTWAYRIAVNQVLTERDKRRRHASFEELAAALDAGLVEAGTAAPAVGAAQLLVEETRLVCTQGMLTALDRDHRIAFVLSELAELSGEECADILEISHEALRKRVSRARTRLADFMRGRCGVFDVAALCRCARQVPCLVRIGAIDPARPRLASHPVRGGGGRAGGDGEGARAPVRRRDEEGEELVNLLDAVRVLKTHPDYAAPATLASALQVVLKGGAPPL